MAEEITLTGVDRRVRTLEQWREGIMETIDLKIQNAINAAVIRILLGIGGLLVLQSVIERIIGI